MENCEQAPGLNMLQHGQLVHHHYKVLIEHLENGGHESDALNKLYSLLKNQLPPLSVLQKYHWYHDCGKHLCLTIDENGRRQYPNHAEISAQQYGRIFPEDGFTRGLILHDMDFHIMRGEEIDELWKNPLAPILFFTSIAEVNANAEMFGGRSSDSYKIKMKRLIQHAKRKLK